MKAVILESSPLVQNVYRAILSPFYQVDCTKHIADLDILLDDDDYDAIVIGENAFNLDAWKGLEARNFGLRNIPRVFISFKNEAPEGFENLKRPFIPEELLRILEIETEQEISPGELKNNTATINNRRLFERFPIKSDVFLNDENQKPIIRLAARDISLGGMFVEGEIPLQVGSMAFLSFKCKDEDVSVTGQVARIGVRGVGVRFLGVPNEVRKYLEA